MFVSASEMAGSGVVAACRRRDVWARVWAALPFFPPGSPPVLWADQAARYGLPAEALRPGAPSTHTVQTGDTLWGLAQRYLHHAWQWPLLWGLNRAQWPDPHRIFPGQVLRLQAPARPLGGPGFALLAQGDASGAALPLTPGGDAWWHGSATEGWPAGARPVLALAQGRRWAVAGDVVYTAGGGESSVAHASVWGPVRRLCDAQTGECLAQVCQRLATARRVPLPPVSLPPDWAAWQLSHGISEVAVADGLVPSDLAPALATVPAGPHAALSGVSPKVLAFADPRVRWLGAQQTLWLNRGQDHGVGQGQVWDVWPATDDPLQPNPDPWSVAQVLVLQAWPRVALAWVTRARAPVLLGMPCHPPRP